MNRRISQSVYVKIWRNMFMVNLQFRVPIYFWGLSSAENIQNLIKLKTFSDK